MLQLIAVFQSHRLKTREEDKQDCTYRQKIRVTIFCYQDFYANEEEIRENERRECNFFAVESAFFLDASFLLSFTLKKNKGVRREKRAEKEEKKNGAILTASGALIFLTSLMQV